MTPEKRIIVYEAAPPTNDAPVEQDGKEFPNSTFTIISKVAYLIGVPKRFFENEHSSPKIEIYQDMDREKNARIVRHLCILRTAIEQNYGRIYRAFQYDLKIYTHCRNTSPRRACSSCPPTGSRSYAPTISPFNTSST